MYEDCTAITAELYWRLIFVINWPAIVGPCIFMVGGGDFVTGREVRLG